MVQRSGATGRGRAAGAAKDRGRKASPKAISRLEKSIDAAELALKDLRRELGRGGRDLVRDLEVILKDSRKNLRSLSRTMARDLGKVQRAAMRGSPPKAPRRSTSAKGATRRTTGRGSTRGGARGG